MTARQFADHVRAHNILARIKAEISAVPLGEVARNRIYKHSVHQDVDVAGIAAHAPDGAERWSIDIVGGTCPLIELTMWHGVDTVSLAFTPYELAAIDRANAHLGGLIAKGLNRYDTPSTRALSMALDDRHDLVLQSALEGFAR